MKRFNANTGQYVELTTEEVAEHQTLIKEATSHEKSINDAKALKETNRTSGKAKLKSLGLSDDEILALFPDSSTGD